jgi:hypothetical protein
MVDVTRMLDRWMELPRRYGTGVRLVAYLAAVALAIAGTFWIGLALVLLIVATQIAEESRSR